MQFLKAFEYGAKLGDVTVELDRVAMPRRSLYIQVLRVGHCRMLQLAEAIIQSTDAC